MATIKNVDRLLSRLNNIANMELKETMIQATTFVHAQAKDLAPADKGILAGSIHMEVTKNSKNIEGRVYTNTQYAAYAEFGTGIKGNGTYPYKIKGINLSYKNKKWRGKIPNIGVRWISGQIAQPYMYPALKQNEKYIKQLFKTGVHRKLKENCKGGQ